MITKKHLLYQLGITQWLPIFPTMLKATYVLKLPKHIRLLLITNETLSLEHALIVDVALSLALITEQLYILSPKEVLLLSNNMYYHSWWLGVKILRNFSGITICTPSLIFLVKSVKEKRLLWQQIYNYKYNLIKLYKGE